MYSFFFLLVKQKEAANIYLKLKTSLHILLDVEITSKHLAHDNKMMCHQENEQKKYF